MSIRGLSLRELRVLAQQQLGLRAAELKTRQELIDGLEAHEAKGRRPARRLVVPAAVVEPAAVFPVRELPPEPMIWTGHSALPKITQGELEGPKNPPEVDLHPERSRGKGESISEQGPKAEFADESKTSGRADGRSTKSASLDSARDEAASLSGGLSGDEARGTRSASLDSARDEAASLSGDFSESAERSTGSASLDSARDEVGSSRRANPPARSSTVVVDFFIPRKPPHERLPDSYGDDRVLTFVRDPYTIYAAWDFAAAQFDFDFAVGRVVDATGETLGTFPVATVAGGSFVEALPQGRPLKVEVHRGPMLLAESPWITLDVKPSAPAEAPPAAAPIGSSRV